MGQVIEWEGFRIHVPETWEARLIGKTILVFPRESSALVDMKEPVDAVHGTVIESDGETLEGIATKAMSRRVQQGEPEFFATRFAGIPALEYVWSDGVTRVVSWFLTHRDTLYEIQLTEPWLRQRGGEHLAIEGRAFCESGFSPLNSSGGR
jgi:hypothetical protein